jgi:hypothetical protein
LYLELQSKKESAHDLVVFMIGPLQNVKESNESPLEELVDCAQGRSDYQVYCVGIHPAVDDQGFDEPFCSMPSQASKDQAVDDVVSSLFGSGQTRSKFAVLHSRVFD